MTDIRYAVATSRVGHAMMLRPLLAVVLLLLAVNGAKAQTQGAARLSLVAELKGPEIRLQLRNEGDGQAKISADFAFSGRSGGNVMLIAISPRGQVMPPCVILDSMSPWFSPRQMAPHAVEEVWVGTASQLTQWHCLVPGQYNVRFGYQSPSGNVVFSDPLTLRVGEDSSSIDKGSQRSAAGSSP